MRVTTTDAGVTIETDEGRSADVSWRWLRDHGEDPGSYNHATSQRRVYALGDAPRPATAVAVADDRVSLTWPDEPTQTWIGTPTLASLVDTRAPSCATAWRDSDELPPIEQYTVGDVLTDDGALAHWLRDLATWGFARLRGYDGTRDQVSAIAARVGYVRETIFGGLWDLASDVSDHDDTAYTQSFLAPHTDGTYSHEAPGLQMFCCVERSGTGGESIIVDGMGIANDLQAEHPEHFELLSRVDVPAHYIEPGVELRAARPALRTLPDGTLTQLSLNNYDRSPMLLPADEMERFYEAYGTLQRMADDESRWHAVRLEAGDVLINDNWRVLHGRMAYTGARRFVGCYMNHEDFESRCRTLGLAI